MTCTAVLRVVASAWGFEKQYLVPCNRPHKEYREDGMGKGYHTPDLSELPLKFGGTTGQWKASIRV